MSRLRLLLATLLLSVPAFSSDAAVKKILVRYRTHPTSGRVLAVQSLAVPAKIQTAAAMATYKAATSALERTVVVDLPPGADLETEMQKWRARADVELVEPNYLMHVSFSPNDSSYPDQWALKNTGQAGNHDSFDPAIGMAGDDVDAEAAWNIQTGSTSTILAVIDAGISVGHEDLSANILSGFDFGDNDANPDDNCTNTFPSLDASGHGTHVTGIIAAVGNNNKGVIGIDWTGSIMPLKVADHDCTIQTDSVVSAINYARTHGANVINMSLGGEHTAALKAAVDAADAAGIVIVAAAGNESTEDTTNSYPAAYSTSLTSHVIAVAATDRNDQLASFSNRGSWITLSAPGVGILSTFPSNQYRYMSGTSMSSPLVAGVAALILSENPLLTPAEVRTQLQAACENIDSQNPGLSGKIGAGRLNALNALFSITSVSPSTAPNSAPITVQLNGFNLTGSVTAILSRTGQTDIVGTGLVVHSSSWATVTFDLTGVQGGRWPVTLQKISGSSTTLIPGLGVIGPSFNALVLDPSLSYTQSLTGAHGTQTLVWPAGVFSQSVDLDMDAAPVSVHAVNASIDPYVATNVAIELTPSPSGLTFRKSFTLTLTYDPTSLPDPTKETALTLARYNTITGRWEPLNSTVNTTANTVTASVSHLSTFAILQHTASINLNRAIAFPNPFRASLGHSRVTFDFLTAGSRVRLYDVNGSLVRDLPDDDNDGRVIWDMKTDGGDNVASGMYFYLITDPAGNKEHGRIGVIR